MTNTIQVPRELLERLQERLDPHLDARDWGLICDLLAQPAAPADGEAVEVVASIAVDAEDVVRDFTLEPGLDRHPGGYTVAPLMTVAQHQRILAQRDAEIALLKAAAEFDAAPDDAEWEPPHPIFQMAADIDRLNGELAQRDAKLAGVVEALKAELEEARAGQRVLAHELEAARVASVPDATGRTAQDYAIEHARYMATDARNLLDALSQAYDEDVITPCEMLSEAMQRLAGGIYEFEKRRERAAAQPQAAGVPERKETGEWESARIGDFNSGWNACRDEMVALLEKAACMELDTTKRSISIQDDIRALLAAAPQPQAQGWIPVSERLPDVEQRLDEPCEIEGTPLPPLNITSTVQCFDGKRVFADAVGWFDGGQPMKGVTHWKPLDAAPAAIAAAQEGGKV